MVLQALRKAPLVSISGWINELSINERRKQDEWTVDQLPSKDEQPSQKLLAFVCTIIPQLQSRIAYAVKSILPELTRGHFVPMLTVALACLGRIRSVLMSIGQECLACLHKNKVHIERTDHLFDISHDEVVVKLNDFVNELRWTDVVRKFGLDKSFLEMKRDNKENAMVCSTEEESKQSATAANLDNDMGEIVAGVSTGFEDEVSVCIANVEENTKSKKKKRKKKKNSCDTSETDVSCIARQQQDLSKMGKGQTNASSDDFDAMLDEKDDGSKQRNLSDSYEEVTQGKKSKKKKELARDIDAIFDGHSSVRKRRSTSGEDSKRKKKKSKKKRGSVIDDIFG